MKCLALILALGLHRYLYTGKGLCALRSIKARNSIYINVLGSGLLAQGAVVSTTSALLLYKCDLRHPLRA